MLYDVYKRNAEYLVFPTQTPPPGFDAKKDKWKLQQQGAPERLIVPLGKPITQIQADIVKSGFSQIRDRLGRS